MNLVQALRYFLHEAAVSLVRSWKVSALAVLTIAVSLFVGGALMLLTSNLSDLVSRWRAQAKLVVYLTPEATADAVSELITEARAHPGVVGVESISAQTARARFERSFPSLDRLVEGWKEEPLPASVEISFDPARIGAEELAAWAEELRGRPEAALVDDDRDWLSQLSAMIAVGRGVGLGLGAVLLGAAVFTIASVIRLTAYLYHEEITIMRIVGATEFFIRGPFYLEGLLQGLLGGVLAVAALYGAHAAAVARVAGSVWGELIIDRFLGLPQVLFLIALGGAAGLAGAVLSLRRESLGAPPDSEVDWPQEAS
ncbi:MAG: permease-like cell division protein FtsX [Acidobacteria bacterium]|nr:permease-like cell division protein FtsX [Acidobacteriota bacterium]